MLSEKYLLKLEEGTLARIDAVAENRAVFVRAAIERALGGVYTPVDDSGAGIYAEKPVKAPQPLKPVRERVEAELRPDDAEMLDYFRGRKGASERQARMDLGWPEMRVGRCVSRLVNAGRLTVVSSGYYAAVAD